MKQSPNLRQMLSSAAEYIRKAERLGKTADADPFMSMVADNAYYYRRIIRETNNQLNQFDKLAGREGIPYAFRSLWTHFKKHGFVYEKDTPLQAFEDYDCSSLELDLLKSLIIAAALVETGLVCKGAIHKQGGGTARLQNAFKLMKAVEITDFSYVYPLLSESERRLSQREPLYMQMTDNTKGMYRSALRRYAEKHNCTEKEAVLKAEEIAERRKVPIGSVLGVDKKASAVPYMLTVAFVFIAMFFAAAKLCPLWGLALIIVPIFSFALGFADFCFSFLSRPGPCPAIDSCKLPKGDHTLTVITTLLTDDEVFGRLEQLYLTNRAEGMFFGILADLPYSKTEIAPADTEHIKRALASLDSLKYRFGNHFCLFIRNRSHDGEGGYCGRERKRGAIEDLVSYIKGRTNAFSIATGADVRKVKFLLTLDGDTKLPPGGAAALTGMMLHPLNRPRILNGKVKRGYGIIQPAVSPCLCTKGNTEFSAMLTGAGGIDVYESAGFNRQQNVFGEGIFCGKGIIDIDAYATLLQGVLPPKRVLSHDLPEGNILRTRYVSDISFTDSVPSGVLSYFSRLHRWIRGDVQNLSLVGGYGQGLRGGIRIVTNVFRHLCPVLSFAVLLLAGFFINGAAGLWLCFFAVINMLSPVFYTVISRPAALRFRARRFFSSVQSGMVQSLRIAFFELYSLSYKSLITLDAFIKALWRLIRGKKLLKWVTSAQGEKATDGGIILYIYRLFPSAAVGAVAFFATKLWITRLLGLLWFLFPVFAFRLSCKIREKPLVTADIRRNIKTRALAIWQFFEDNVGENTAWLPPDNIQLSPVEATAYRTSPTNIGLYLLCIAAAEDFGFITKEQAEDRIDKAVTTLESLSKWKGHLYNWYSLDNCNVIGGGYVSTVDSGNFCVCMVALSRFLYSGGNTGLARRAEQLFAAADFAALYNGDRKLFALGANGDTGKLSDICYDLYMSEARSTSYFAIATGQVPVNHWRHLGRPVVGNGGHIGMASWSGTAFEYFMPQLFLPIYKNSFIYESLCFALYEQRTFSAGRLWGCSESAFLAYDSEMNYQYKAHGVQSLALARYSYKELILSPYSVYLTMCIAPKEALKTLAAYDKSGMQGKYGLYEAIDFTASDGEGTAIHSYMAHHMGMSLIACANACFDNIFVNRFMNFPPAAAFYELLQEKIPTGALIYDAEKQASGKKPHSARVAFQQQLAEYKGDEPVIHAFGNGLCTVVADSYGHLRLSHGGITVNEATFDRNSLVKSLNVAFCSGKDVFYATPGGNGKYSFENGAGYSAHICASSEFSGRVKYYTDPSGSFIAETKSDAGKSYALVFSFHPQLCEDKEFYAHPAFNRLFISAEYDKEATALVYSKNSRNGRDCLFMAVALDDAKIPISFETNKESYGAFSMYHPNKVLKDSYTEKAGVCVTPFCLIKTPPLAGGAARFIISVGHTRKECLERLYATRRMCCKSVGNSVFGERENPILQGIFWGKGRFAKTDVVKESSLWSYGVSGDYPIISVLIRDNYSADAEFFIDVFKKLAAMNIRTELVFLLCEEDVYQAPLRKALFNILTKMKCQHFVQKRGGIFFAEGNDPAAVALFKEASVYYTESYDTVLSAKPYCHCPSSLPPVERQHSFTPPKAGKAVGGGFYDAHGFTVDKDMGQTLPFSYVLAGKSFGSVVTQSTLGYSFYRNAALCRIAAFDGDPHSGDGGEVLYAFINGKLYDLIACASSVRYQEGIAFYEGNADGNAYSVEVFVCNLLPTKAIRVSFGTEVQTVLKVVPAMGASLFSNNGLCVSEFSFKGGRGMSFVNPKNSFFQNISGFVACVGTPTLATSLNQLLYGEQCTEDSVVVSLISQDAVFLIGAAPSKEAMQDVCNQLVGEGYSLQRQCAIGFAKSFLPPVKLLGDGALAVMFNTFAPYQVAACRFFARGAFYQSGGAYGFRDQLQDCMFLVYSMPKTVRCHLLRAASRQYTDGSVQHWWHPCRRDGMMYGVKTKCSDDFMWLPIAVAEYVEKTGDRSVLSEQVSYLVSPPLGDSNERYEAADSTDYTESLEQHCRRAINYGTRFGTHGLPLMGSCDWNDAFSDLGDGAESVFCAFLYVVALNKLYGLTGDIEYKNQAQALLKRAEEAYEDHRYIRAYSGNGTPLGVEGRGACQIDALVQAFAVFAGADKEKCLKAMANAFEKLYDKENRLLKLFAPAFGRDTEYAGYINAYCKGLRENGGQYTHAAVWFAAALAICGMKDEALLLLDGINPLKRSENSILYAKYKGEPYAIAADIYAAKGQIGRMGWSHYTGAAAWFCKTVLEVFMGINISGFDRLLSVKPLMEYEATLNYKGTLTIKAYKGAALSYDGNAVSFPINLEEGEHVLTVPVE